MYKFVSIYLRRDALKDICEGLSQHDSFEHLNLCFLKYVLFLQQVEPYTIYIVSSLACHPVSSSDILAAWEALMQSPYFNSKVFKRTADYTH